MRYAAIAILMLCSTAGAQQTAPGDSMEAQGSVAVGAVTLDDLDQFPDQHQGAFVLEGLRVDSCSRFTRYNGTTFYSLSLSEPSTGTTTRDRDLDVTFGTIVESNSLGDTAARLYKRYQDSPARVSLYVRPSTAILLDRSAKYEGVVTSIEWLGQDGKVVASAH